MIAILRCDQGQIHGYIKISEVNSGLLFDVNIKGLSSGKHGFHIHRSGNDFDGPAGLCSHYNPTGGKHSYLNDINGHYGDLGNLIFDKDGICQMKIISKLLRSGEILGRSIVIHSDEDDLGFSNNQESKITGNSGSRILWGIIGRDEDCQR